MLPLEILAVVPFDHWIFQLTNSICITKYFKNSISYFSCFSVITVGKYSIRTRLSHRWWKPFDWINIYHSLHIKKINCNLYGIILAYLINWLNIWSVNKLRYLKSIKFKWILKLFQLLLLLLFIFMHPKDTASTLRFYVHFVISAKLCHSIWLSFVYNWYPTLLTISWNVHICTSHCKLIFKTSPQTFI